MDKRVLTEHEPESTFKRRKEKEEGRWAVFRIHPLSCVSYCLEIMAVGSIKKHTSF